ncbi:MAG: hypothetical protein Q4C84_15570 [Bacillota bacterium]|nr:hypothetical protein [Bacillota bacterium]
MKIRKTVTTVLITLSMSAAFAVPAFAAESENMDASANTEKVLVLEEGLKNGLVNGTKNGLVNGLMNGMKSGLVNGLKNGELKETL